MLHFTDVTPLEPEFIDGGEIEVRGKTLFVGDPCLMEKMDASGTFDESKLLKLHAKNGRWIANVSFVDLPGMSRFSDSVCIVHEDHWEQVALGGGKCIELGAVPIDTARLQVRSVDGDGLMFSTGLGDGYYPVIGWTVRGQLVGIASMFFKTDDDDDLEDGASAGMEGTARG